MLPWVFFKWNERWRWMLGFVATLLVLFAASEYLLPGWLGEFGDGLRAYQKYTGGQSALDVFLPPLLAIPLRILVVVQVMRVCWRTRSALGGTPASRYSLCLMLTASLCVAPNFAAYNQVLLLPAVLWSDGRRWLSFGTNRLARFLAWLFAALLSWPWLICTLMMLATGIVPAETVGRFWQVPLYFSIALPVAMLGFLLVVPSAKVSSQQTFPEPEMLA
jgi:hypothetical protein